MANDVSHCRSGQVFVASGAGKNSETTRRIHQSSRKLGHSRSGLEERERKKPKRVKRFFQITLLGSLVPSVARRGGETRT